MTNVLKLGADYLIEGRGLGRFAIWCREAVAYERRLDEKRYQRWLAKRSAAPVIGASNADFLEVLSVDDDAIVPVSTLTSCKKTYMLLQPEGTTLPDGAVARMLACAEDSHADLVYPDEDLTSATGPCRPFFKPGFSIDLALASDYIGPCILFNVDAARQALADVTSDEVTPFALVLELHAAGAQIVRCADATVSWNRQRSRTLNARQRQASRDFMIRSYGNEVGPALDAFGETRPQTPSKVSVVIPTKNRVDLLDACVRSIYGAAENIDLEVIILDNRSDEPEAIAWLNEAPDRFENLRVLPADYDFNWSRLNNHGAAVASGDTLIFLNNDIETSSTDWISLLCLHTRRHDVGAVGPLLRFPNGDIQHAGVVLGIGGFADHVYACAEAAPDVVHQFVSPFLPRNVLACTGACLAVARDKFEKVGGFNESLKICGDIDFCARLYAEGFQNVYEPRIDLVHHESATRSKAPLPQQEMIETRTSIQRYLDHGDPFYNPNLSLGIRYPSCFG